MAWPALARLFGGAIVRTVSKNWKGIALTIGADALLDVLDMDWYSDDDDPIGGDNPKDNKILRGQLSNMADQGRPSLARFKRVCAGSASLCTWFHMVSGGDTARAIRVVLHDIMNDEENIINNSADRELLHALLLAYLLAYSSSNGHTSAVVSAKDKFSYANLGKTDATIIEWVPPGMYAALFRDVTTNYFAGAFLTFSELTESDDDTDLVKFEAAYDVVAERLKDGEPFNEMDANTSLNAYAARLGRPEPNSVTSETSNLFFKLWRTIGPTAFDFHPSYISHPLFNKGR